MGIDNVWDERNGLLWAEPFEKASERHLNEIAMQMCCHDLLYMGMIPLHDIDRCTTNHGSAFELQSH